MKLIQIMETSWTAKKMKRALVAIRYIGRWKGDMDDGLADSSHQNDNGELIQGLAPNLVAIIATTRAV